MLVAAATTTGGSVVGSGTTIWYCLARRSPLVLPLFLSDFRWWSGCASTTTTTPFSALYRRVLVAARRFPSPMFRDYFLRHARGKFRNSCARASPDFLTEMKAHAELLERQSRLHQLYHVEHMMVYR